MKKSFFSLKYLLWIQLVFLGLNSYGQQLDRECVNGNTGAQAIIADKTTLFNQLSSQLLSDVQALIQQQSITNAGSVLSFENLESVVTVANQLDEYDKQYDNTYAEYCEAIVQSLWSSSVCNSGFSLENYREEVFEYLEEEKFTLVDDYASTVFAQELSFQSALLKINTDEEDWLISVGENFDNNNPAFNQLINNELYWPVLSEDWNIELRNPEPELNNVTGYSLFRSYINNNWHGRLVSGPNNYEVNQGYDLLSILQFIFDNWDSIENILAWLTENVTYDCNPTTSSHVSNDWRGVPTYMSPDKERKIYYHVRQKGVFGDLKATKTKIEGKVKLYKKKGNRFKKDRNNLVGIGYCTLQWNPCDDQPWPVNDNPHIYGGSHGHKKTKFKHMHPYAFTIERSNDFLTYYLYYNQQFTGEVIYALGGNISCT
ncbi:MAG TPA: hypothetical protein PKI55_05895 [Chitinophagaceae bacterium]|nr:hypothetical protein [Chitinophagaceae bacterium]